MSVEGSVVGSNWTSDILNDGASEYKKLEPQLETAFQQLKADFSDYNIVMSGHSLGGGIAQTFGLKHNLDVQTLDSLPIPKALFDDGTVSQQELDTYKASHHQVDAMYTSLDIATFWYDQSRGCTYLWRETGQAATELPGAHVPTALRWALAPISAPGMAMAHMGGNAADAVAGLSLDERGKFIIPQNPSDFAAIPPAVRTQMMQLNTSPIVKVESDHQTTPEYPSFMVTHMNSGQQWTEIDLQRQQAVVLQRNATGFERLTMPVDGQGNGKMVQYGPDREVLSAAPYPLGHQGQGMEPVARTHDAPAMDARQPAQAQPAATQDAPQHAGQPLAPSDPRDSRHPDHAMYQSVSRQLVALNDTQGIKLTPQQLDNCTAAALADARGAKMRTIDSMDFAVHRGTDRTDPSKAALFQGTPGDPVSLFTITNLAQAVNTPAEQSFQRFTQNTQQMAQHEQQMQAQRQQWEQQAQGGPTMRIER